MMMFYEKNARTIRKVADSPAGVWVVDYEYPGAPYLITHDELSAMELVTMPEDFGAVVVMSDWQREVKDKRMDVLRPLVEGEHAQRVITDARERQRLMSRIAAEHELSVKTVTRWYHQYLARGVSGLYPQKRRLSRSLDDEIQQNFRWAVNKYYYSSRNMSLRETYDMLILARYTKPDGTLTDGYPSFSQMKYYFYKVMKNDITTAIARSGLSSYQRNCRPLYGKSKDYASNIGIYQLDATPADIHLVSSNDRSLPIGRPQIYMAVDIASQLIAGIYVGLEQNEAAFASCLRNAAEDKVAFCARYGIEITRESWPSQGLPSEIVTDRGREFMGKRADELCALYGVVCTGLPPYRPDLKGLVEKTFDMLQQRYKPILAHRGVIATDNPERGAPDYRAEAVLTLHEFTQIVIYCVLHLNSARIIESYTRPPEMVRDNVNPISSQIWQWLADNNHSSVVKLTEEDECLTLLPRDGGKITRHGLEFCGLCYCNREYDQRCASAGQRGQENVTVAYDPLTADYVYLFERGRYIRFELSCERELFGDTCFAEVSAYLSREKKARTALREKELQSRIQSARRISEISNDAADERDGLISGGSLLETRVARDAEKELRIGGEES